MTAIDTGAIGHVVLPPAHDDPAKHLEGIAQEGEVWLQRWRASIGHGTDLGDIQRAGLESPSGAMSSPPLSPLGRRSLRKAQSMSDADRSPGPQE